MCTLYRAHTNAICDRAALNLAIIWTRSEVNEVGSEMLSCEIPHPWISTQPRPTAKAVRPVLYIAAGLMLDVCCLIPPRQPVGLRITMEAWERPGPRHATRLLDWDLCSVSRSARVSRLFVCNTYRANRTKTAAIPPVTFERDLAMQFNDWYSFVTGLMRNYCVFIVNEICINDPW